MPQVNHIPRINSRPWLVVVVLLLTDLVSIGLALGGAALLRQVLIPIMGGVISWDRFIPLLATNAAIIVVVYALTGMYPGVGRTAIEEMQQIFYAITLGYGVLSLVVYFQQASIAFPRTVFGLGWILACLFNLLARAAVRNRFSLLPWWGAPIVVIGPYQEAEDVIQRLKRSRRLGFRPVLLLDENSSLDSIPDLGVPVIHAQAELGRELLRQKISYAIFTGSIATTNSKTLRWVSEAFSTVLVVLSSSPLGSLWVKTMDLEGRLTLRGEYHLLDQRATITKRIFDFVLGLIGFIVFLPFLLIIAVLIRLDSPGSALFGQDRLGTGGKTFRCYKFRTMAANAEEHLDKILANDKVIHQEYQRFHKLANDPRITRMGRILRKFSLDELPQLWNVLLGQMSLVGPRAYLPSEKPDMGDSAHLILRIRPGLTGWWQVMGRHQTTFNSRIELDEYYLSNWSLWLDIYILIKTVWVLVSGKGA
jgi:Undecaprenyl-phosphate galactose phosphotransferase WbaP